MKVWRHGKRWEWCAACPQRSPPSSAWHYGGFWIRFVAKIIDGIILFVLNAIVRGPFMLMGLGMGAGFGRGLIFGPALAGMAGISALIGLAIGVAYEVYFLSAHGATPGKMALGLRVIRADGGPISPMLALARHFAEWISAIILMIGYIMAGFDPEKRALHDRICETRVIYSR